MGVLLLNVFRLLTIILEKVVVLKERLIMQSLNLERIILLLQWKDMFRVLAMMGDPYLILDKSAIRLVTRVSGSCLKRRVITTSSWVLVSISIMAWI